MCLLSLVVKIMEPSSINFNKGYIASTNAMAVGYLQFVGCLMMLVDIGFSATQVVRT